MSQEIIPHVSMNAIAQAASFAACKTILNRYKQEKSKETLRRQSSDIDLFEKYLSNAGYIISGIKNDLSLWNNISYGIVAGFQQWQLQEGYSIGSVNVRLATIKSYCEMANQAAYIDQEEITKIRGIRNIGRKAGRNVDEKREVQRVGKKKAQTVLLSEPYVQLIKKKLSQSNKERDAARDYLIFCLLADHGLRVGEVAELSTRDLNVATGMLTFYRRKVDKTQIHRLTADTLEAAKNYIQVVSPGEKLFSGYAYLNKKSSEDGLTTRAINKIVTRLGETVDIKGLSPHDLRHYWATNAIRKGTDVKALQQAGGWNSPYMPLRYAEESEIANEGVKLG
jgi:integrase